MLPKCSVKMRFQVKCILSMFCPFEVLSRVSFGGILSTVFFRLCFEVALQGFTEKGLNIRPGDPPTFLRTTGPQILSHFIPWGPRALAHICLGLPLECH